jgi:hypothetical protein
MKPAASNMIWGSFLLLLVLACSAGTVHAQRAEQRAQSAQPGSETGAMPGQGDMEGRRGGQEGMVQMT